MKYHTLLSLALFALTCQFRQVHAQQVRLLEIPKAWSPVAQPDLQAQLDRAPMLPVEELGIAVSGLDACGYNLVHNPDRESYDVLVWYRKQYRQSTRAYIVDLGTGEVSKQEFTEAENRARVEMALTWFYTHAPDGMLYGAITDQNLWLKGGMMRIYRYDPAKNRVELFKEIKGHAGERNPIALAPNGWIYGAATWVGPPDAGYRASAYGFDPKTGEVRNYGPIGPRIDSASGAFGYSMGTCDTHIYVAVGKMPWYLVAVDIKSGEEKVLLNAPEGGFGMQVFSGQESLFGGAVCYTQQTTDPSTRRYYWLHHGRAIPKQVQSIAIDDSCPWSQRLRDTAPLRTRPIPPEIHEGQLYPDDDDRAVLWWRPGARAGQKSNGPWSKVVLESVKKHPLMIHRFHSLPDGRLFGSGAGAKGRFVFDPETQETTYLGDGGGSLYALTSRGDKVFWSGYALGQIFEFDPARPWNLNKGGPPGSRIVTTTSRDVFSRDVNPRKVHADHKAVFDLTRVKKMLSATTAADGRVYFGGKGQRDYSGGGLAWYDPDTEEIGGLWKPFVDQDIGWVTTAVGGRYVVIGTQGGKLHIYDTQSQALLADKSFTPVPGADVSGPLLEVAPGLLLGITRNGLDRYSGVIYGVEIPSGRVLLTKQIPWGLPFNWNQGTGKWDYARGPDGFVWATLENQKAQAVLVRIDPRDARVHVLGRIGPSGKLAFVGRDLYLTGTEQIRRLTNIVPQE